MRKSTVLHGTCNLELANIVNIANIVVWNPNGANPNGALHMYRGIRSNYTLGSQYGPISARRVDRSIPTVYFEFGNPDNARTCMNMISLPLISDYSTRTTVRVR